LEETGGLAPRVKIRIESLSDLVFGLALSIGALFLVGNPPQNGQGIIVNVALFGFGFFIVVMTWLGYSRTMAVLPQEVPFALVANMTLLFPVAIEPYLFFVLVLANSPGLADAASVVYAVDVGGLFLAQAALAKLVVKEGEGGRKYMKEIHPLVLARFKRVFRLDLAVGAIFLVSAFPFFWVTTPGFYLRFYFWMASFFVFPLLRPYRASKTPSSWTGIGLSRVGDVERLDPPVGEPCRALAGDRYLVAAAPAAIGLVEVPPGDHEAAPFDRDLLAARAVRVLVRAAGDVAHVGVVEPGLRRDLPVPDQELVGGYGEVEELVVGMEPRELDGDVGP